MAMEFQTLKKVTGEYSHSEGVAVTAALRRLLPSGSRSSSLCDRSGSQLFGYLAGTRIQRPRPSDLRKATNPVCARRNPRHGRSRFS